MRSSRVNRIGRDEPVTVEDRPSALLFNPGPRLRQLRVIHDVDSSKIPGEGDPRGYLLGLLDDPSIVMWRYSDDGPPADAERFDGPWVQGAVGWITVAEDGLSCAYGQEDWVMNSAVRVGDWETLVRQDVRDEAYSDLDDEAAAERRLADLRLLKVAHAAKADLLITDRPYLQSNPYNAVSHGITEVAPQYEAVAIVGLYLRTQGRFISDADPSGMRLSFNKGLMTWVASRSLLPEGWRWMSACVSHSSHTGLDHLTHYAGTVHQRLERALAARDQLFVALNQPQDNDTADDAMAALDNILVNLSSCLDVTARVYNHAIGEPVPSHQVGWRRDDWRKKVRTHGAGGAELVVDPTFTNLITVVGELRNTIHGAALDSLSVSRSATSGRDETMVGLPADRLDQLLTAMDALGGRESWGVRELIPGRAHAEPDVLCERLMREVPAALNTVMKLTPLEGLPGVGLTATDRQPDESRGSPFQERYRRNILLQYGLSQGEL